MRFPILIRRTMIVTGGAAVLLLAAAPFAPTSGAVRPAGPDDVALVVTRAEVEQDRAVYVREAFGLTGTEAAQAARAAEIHDVATGRRPVHGASYEVVGSWVETPRHRVWVRVTMTGPDGPDVFTWEWVLDRRDGRWVVVDRDLNPGGETMPTG